MLPTSAGDVPNRSRATWRAAGGPGQAEVAAGLVDPDEPAGLDPPGLLVPGAPLRPVALAGPPRLFPRVHPHPRVSARLIVACLTRIPEPCPHHAPCSASVASGWASRRGSSPARKPTGFTAGGPERGDCAGLPVSRRRRRHRVNVAVDTPISRITSDRGVPRSSAASARTRTSREYPLIMPSAGRNDYLSRKPLYPPSWNTMTIPPYGH